FWSCPVWEVRGGGEAEPPSIAVATTPMMTTTATIRAREAAMRAAALERLFIGPGGVDRLGRLIVFANAPFRRSICPRPPAAGARRRRPGPDRRRSRARRRRGRRRDRPRRRR